VFRVFFFQSVKHQIHGVLKVLVVLPRFACVYHVKQGRKILFFLRGFVVDVADQCGVVELFRFRPKILGRLFALAFGVYHDCVDKFQYVFFAVQVGKGVVVHTLFEIDCVKHFYLIAAPV
jgi:hypothetical protein